MVDAMAKQVEAEKMKAIGARNHLKSIAKERESQKQQLQALIAEKKMQLERSVLCIRIFNSHTYCTCSCDYGMVKMLVNSWG